ncbi:MULTISPECIES: hypothetical protein [Planktothricoides]|uniref:Uncharacterized protein n=1 Tax=Planktothricoides raciborskii GIHE-MW2 TaxID=2792601 RepID=A0AAU8J9Z6_9CYAN|nr:MULTISPECIES: hypothetical protein [Planktothricoides]
MDTDTQQDKWKERQVLENYYSNFVEPHVNEFIEVNTQSLSNVPIASARFCCTYIGVVIPDIIILFLDALANQKMSVFAPKFRW